MSPQLHRGISRPAPTPFLTIDAAHHGQIGFRTQLVRGDDARTEGVGEVLTFSRSQPCAYLLRLHVTCREIVEHREPEDELGGGLRVHVTPSLPDDHR